MKTTFLFFLLTVFCFGQNKNLCEEKILFKNAETLKELLFDDTFYDYSEHPKNETEEKIGKEFVKLIEIKRLEIFNEIIKNYPESENYIVALYEKGMIKLMDNEFDEAKSIFLQIINTEGNNWKYYRNESYILLTEIALKNKQYEVGKSYLDKRKENGFEYLCGTEYEVKTSVFNRLYKMCEEGLKTSDKN